MRHPTTIEWIISIPVGLLIAVISTLLIPLKWNLFTLRGRFRARLDTTYRFESWYHYLIRDFDKL